jgi:hypothetical protein
MLAAALLVAILCLLLAIPDSEEPSTAAYKLTVPLLQRTSYTATTTAVSVHNVTSEVRGDGSKVHNHVESRSSLT